MTNQPIQIRIQMTYDQTTPESLNEGDFSETGLMESGRYAITAAADASYLVDVEDLAELFESHIHPSDSPLESIDQKRLPSVWFTTESSTIDHGTDTRRRTSIHFHLENTPAAKEAWVACIRQQFGLN